MGVPGCLGSIHLLTGRSHQAIADALWAQVGLHAIQALCPQHPTLTALALDGSGAHTHTHLLRPCIYERSAAMDSSSRTVDLVLTSRLV